VQRRALAWGLTVPQLDGLATDVRLAVNFSHSGAFRSHITTAALTGSRLVGFPLDRLPPATLLERLGGEGITGLLATPSVIRRLHLAARGSPALPGVRSVISFGEVLRWSDVTRVRELCGTGVTVVNRYGSTEAGLVTERIIAPDEATGDGPIDVGRPWTGRSVWIDRGDGTAAAPDEVGRIVVEGPFTTEGFPLEDLGDGIARFRSGDLGRIDASGALWFEGRADRMVKVAGMRVEPGTIEDILRGVPGVLEVAVLPVPVGEGEVRLVAHVVVAEDGPDVDELRRATAERVIAVAVPVRFHLRRDPLPLLAAGKVDGRALMAGDG